MESLKFSRLVEFNNAARAYLGNFPDERSKTTFALDKLLKFYQKKIEAIQAAWQKELNEDTDDIRALHWDTDENGNFKEKTYGEGKDMVIRKIFKGKQELVCNKLIRAKSAELEKKWMDKDIEEIKTHIVPVPKSMDIAFIEVFQDFIYAPMDEAKLEAHYMAQGKESQPEPKELRLEPESNGQ